MKKDKLFSVNDWAESYDKHLINKAWFGPEIMFGLMYEFIKPNETILDIGIGTGLSSIPFKRFGLKIYGIDSSEKMLELCKSKNIAENLCSADFGNKEVDCFKGKTFDHVISHAVFHIIGNLENIFSTTAGYLKQGGYFAFTYEGLSAIADESFKKSETEGMYVKECVDSGMKRYKHSDDYIHNMLNLNNFEIIKKTEYLAFADIAANINTYFRIIVARKA